MNAVGIDVSRGAGTVAAVRPFWEVLSRSFEARRTSKELRELTNHLKCPNGEAQVIPERIGRCHAPAVRAVCQEQVSKTDGRA